MEYFNCHTHSYAHNALYSGHTITGQKQSFGYAPSELFTWKAEVMELPDSVIAIGECGLDRVLKVNWKKQVEVFVWHLRLAQQYHLPLIIHCVRAYGEVLKYLLDHKINTPVIFHGYNGNVQQTQRLLQEDNIYFSFGELLFRKSKAQQVLPQIPLERIFLETDCSAKKIDEIYRQAATLLAVKEATLVKTIGKNVYALWGDKFNVE